MQQTFKVFGVLVLAFFIYIGAPLLLAASLSGEEPTVPVAAEPTITCVTEPIPYETIREEDPDRYISDGDTEPEGGVEGEREICSNANTNEEVSNEVTKEPESAVVYFGTLEDEPEYYYSERIGAICEDGTRSYATGSGACSWHGGVGEWLYD